MPKPKKPATKRLEKDSLRLANEINDFLGTKEWTQGPIVCGLSLLLLNILSDSSKKFREVYEVRALGQALVAFIKLSASAYEDD
jgi:hypothetical protein